MLLCVALQKTTVIEQKLWNAESADPSINIISRSDVLGVIVLQLIAFATLQYVFLNCRHDLHSFNPQSTQLTILVSCANTNFVLIVGGQ